MEGGGATEGGGGGGVRGVNRRRSNKPYKGIRMRKWGKWVAEIREPNKRSRIWLGSYSTPVAAARAYDTAVYYLRGPTAKLNFPDEITVATSAAGGPKDLSAASIREKAVEVGSRVDALHTTGGGAAVTPVVDHRAAPTREMAKLTCWFEDEIDLNKKPKPEPEDSTVDYW